jgi:endonuclease G, mitochondrial
MPLRRTLTFLAFALLALAVLLHPGIVQAQDLDRCSGLFANGQPPALLNPALARQTRPLCFRAFAVLHSGLTRGPLWSAEYLARDDIESARSLQRVDAFHPESAVPPAERAELSDYARSGFDRGHMAPSGDMPDPAAQAQSFSLANMVPQAPELNRKTWAGIEIAVRTLAVRHGALYVVTGPIFTGNDIQALNGRVLIPTEVFKAIYDPSIGKAGAYVCRNEDPTRCRTVSIAVLARRTGIDPFPSLPDSVKSQPMRLPRPTPYGSGRHHQPSLLEQLLR